MTPTSPGRAGAPPTVRVVVVDQHDVVRRGLRDVLASAGGIKVVGDACTAEQAVRLITRLRPDVVITDVSLPGASGIELCRQVLAGHPTARVIVLTACTDPQTVHESILAGACGYLLREIRGDALVEAVRRVAEGQATLDPAVTGWVLERLRHPDGGHEAGLTARERRILDLIVDGMTNREIGTVLGLSEQTVKNHVTGLLAKLNVTRRAQAAAVGARMRRP